MLALFCACSTTASLARIKARAFAGSSSNLTIAPAISVPSGQDALAAANTTVRIAVGHLQS